MAGAFFAPSSINSTCDYEPEGSVCLTPAGINTQTFCGIPPFLSNSSSPPDAPSFIPTAPPTPPVTLFNSSSSFVVYRDCFPVTLSYIVTQVGVCVPSGTTDSKYYAFVDGKVQDFTCWDSTTCEQGIF